MRMLLLIEVCMVDLEQEDGSFGGEGFNGHHGFNRAALASSPTDAGFTEARVQRCHEMVRDGATYPLFLGTGVRRLEGLRS
jgi:hypothetical protein